MGGRRIVASGLVRAVVMHRQVAHPANKKVQICSLTTALRDQQFKSYARTHRQHTQVPYFIFVSLHAVPVLLQFNTSAVTSSDAPSCSIWHKIPSISFGTSHGPVFWLLFPGISKQKAGRTRTNVFINDFSFKWDKGLLKISQEKESNKKE